MDSNTLRLNGMEAIGQMLVSDCVLKSNGKFDIQSEEGKGSKFSVSLPIEEVIQ